MESVVFEKFLEMSRRIREGEVPRSYPVEGEYLCQPGVRGLFYESLPWHGHATRVFGWLGLPEGASASSPAPGVVLVHGGGATALADWVRLWVSRGYAALAMDTCGGIPAWSEKPYYRECWPRHGHSGPAGWGRMEDSGLPPEEQWAFHGVAAVLAGRRLLASLPEVSSQGMGITGISWGGFLTCLAASWDPSFAYAIPVYGCGGFCRGDSNLVWDGGTAEECRRWFTLWDPDLYLSQAEMPFLWLTDAEDEPFPLPAWSHSSSLPKGESRMSLRTNYPHDHTQCWKSRTIFDFAQSVREGKPLPSLGDPVPSPDRGGLSCEVHLAGRTAQEAYLFTTRAAGHWADRVWRPQHARLQEGCLLGSLPPGTQAAFFQIRDERGSLWSGRPFLLPETGPSIPLP